eukprot:6159840-Prymnesium_polylepis.1
MQLGFEVEALGVGVDSGDGDSGGARGPALLLGGEEARPDRGAQRAPAAEGIGGAQAGTHDGAAGWPSIG